MSWWSRVFGSPPHVSAVDRAVDNERNARSDLVDIATELEAAIARLNALPEVKAARNAGRRKGDTRE